MCADCMHAPNPSVQFLGVQHSSSADFFCPRFWSFFSHSRNSDRSNRRPILHGRLRSPKSEKGLFTQNPISLTDDRTTDRPVRGSDWNLPLSRSILSFLSPIEAPKMSITLRKWKREAVFRSVREFLPLPSQSPIELMPRKRGSSKDHYNNTSMPTLSRISSYASKEDYSARAQDGPQEMEII